MNPLADLLSSPLALQVERARGLVAAAVGPLARRDLFGEDAGAGRAAMSGAERRGGGGSARASFGPVALVSVVGVLVPRASPDAEEVFGVVSLGRVAEEIGRAEKDPVVRSIVLDVDSPGGSAYGVSELAARIRACSKPVLASVNSLAAAGAYWLASACDEVHCTPGGEVGSIGIVIAREDCSRALEVQGISKTVISAGQFKAEGLPFMPMTPEERAHLQARVDERYGAMTRDIARGRGVPVERVRTGMGQGRLLGAAQALGERMVDGVMPLGSVIGRARQLGDPKAPSVHADPRRLASSSAAAGLAPRQLEAARVRAWLESQAGER